jgi:hypothetical protein
MEINRNSCIKTILLWEGLFNQYKCYENIIRDNINKLIYITKKIDKEPNYQNIDDIIFHKAMIENSLFFLTKKLNVIKIKLLDDFNSIWVKLDPTKELSDIDKYNFFLLLKQYKLFVDNIFNNTNDYKLCKTTKIENLLELENNINKILEFHLKLIKFLAILSELKSYYYC